ncbi:MAG: hypothetical protein N4A64_04865 [Marinisporobacter sp.]|jgi:UDP-3-O-[3-hydroxymyristoyl] glucosamine N-acyltransferase|nr:hypothetical protein [Marinisporobacter sp.]
MFAFNIQRLNEKEQYTNQTFKNIIIKKAARNINPKDEAIMFYTKWSEELEEKLMSIRDSLILVPENTHIKNNHIKVNNQIVCVDNPRKEYAVILKYILDKNKMKRKYKKLGNNVVVGENVSIGKNTVIEPFVFIDHDVKMGDDCIIKSGARIASYVKIGNNTIIRQNSVLGGQGFGVEREIDGSLIKIPHVGGLIIGDSVEIGALSSIASGTIEPTIIEDNVMIDDNVMIAHNCKIKKGTAITGSVGIGGSVIVGENCFVGSNAILKDHITVGKNCIIGLCAAVKKSLKSNSVVLGNPADTLENMYLKRKALKKIIDELK